MCLAHSSRKTCVQAQQLFLSFCRQHSLQPYPLQELTVRLFTTFLARTASHSTIQTYLAGIRHHHVELGFQSPYEHMHQLRLLLKGIKRIKGSTSKPPRLAVTMERMKLLKVKLRASHFSHQDQCMLWAAFTLAFFGFLRASEYCAPTKHSFDPSSTLLVRDISVLVNKIVVKVKVSKCDPFRRGQAVELAPSGRSICPVRAMSKHLQNCKSSDRPVFIFTDGKFLTRRLVSSIMKQLIGNDKNCARISSHGFRIGAATTAAAANIPDRIIKTLGRWSSDTYQLYIRTPSEAVSKVPRLLASM